MPRNDSPAGIDALLRREGFLIGAAVGAALAAGPAVPGRRRAALALGDELLEELAGGGVDLRRLAGRWLAWRRDDGFEADAPLTVALDCLEEYDAPPDELPAPNAAALAAALPAALASASPRAMLSGGFHIARMLDPDPATGLAAVALIVAAAALLEGHRDFIGDVLSAMRANDAPEAMIDAFRAIPRDPAHAVERPTVAHPAAVDLAAWALWQAYHRGRGVDVLRELAGTGSPIGGAICGALIGARDGTDAWPPEWFEMAEPAVARRRAWGGPLDTG